MVHSARSLNAALVIACRGWPCQRGAINVRRFAAADGTSMDGSTSPSVDGNTDAPRPRVRQHVNPLASSYQVPISLADQWPSILFSDPSLPFHVDVGCAKGTFCMELARSRPDINVLGLEIRRPVAAYSSEVAKASGLPNIGFLSCNANVDLARILDGINEKSRVARVSIQYPDPHWKARLQKRRVVQPELIAAIAARTDQNCDVFLQSDVMEVAQEMRERFREDEAFEDTVADMELWIEVNPTGVPTEREIATFKKGLPVYRALIAKKR